MGVVFWEIPHAPLDLLGMGLETRNFPLLFLNQADGLKNYLDDPIVFLVMILVEPEVVYHHEYPFRPPPPDHVEEGSDGYENVEGSDGLTLPILVHLVEIGTLHTIVFSLITGLALPSTVFLANVFLDVLVLDAVAGFVILETLPSIECIALHAG